MTLALEPWWSRDSDRLVMDADGWALRSADGSNTALRTPHRHQW
jgi:methionyl aminopeptidase